MHHGRREIIISALEAGAGAMKQLRRDGEKTFARKAFGNVADVGIDAESFLHHEQPALRRRARGARDVKPHGSAVAHFGSDEFGFNLHSSPPEFWKFQICGECDPLPLFCASAYSKRLT